MIDGVLSSKEKTHPDGSRAGSCCTGHGADRLFLITPFLLGLGFSFTNQRLTSPIRPSLSALKITPLLGIGVLTLQPEKEADGSISRDADGSVSYPRIRNFTRNNPDYPIWKDAGI